MRIKGTISRELKKDNGTLYCLLSNLDITPCAEDDINEVMAIRDLIAEYPNFYIFLAIPAHMCAVMDQVELACQLENWNGDFLVRPDFLVYNITHSPYYTSFLMRQFWDAIKEAALH